MVTGPAQAGLLQAGMIQKARANKQHHETAQQSQELLLATHLKPTSNFS